MTLRTGQFAHRKPIMRGRARSMHVAFSLVEIMIAIAILGFGLVMMATMFPIAWQRARNLSEFTSQNAATESAHTTLKLLLHVTSPDVTSLFSASSFAGDLVEDPSIVGNYLAYPDQRVHLLHMENLLVSPRSFYPPRDDASAALSPPYKLEGVDPSNILGSAKYFFITGFGHPQIRFEQRVYPPLPLRENVDPATGEFVDDDPKWDDTLASRRFAWVAFHRLLKPLPNPDPFTNDDAESECLEPPQSNLGCPAFLARAREFDMYYATVKRSRVRMRYAQQDPDFAPIPYDPTPIPPIALPETEDVMLPTPWRVQIYVPNDLANPLAPTEDDRVGVPTVVEVNTTNVTTASFVADFFQRGTMFIDEVNGAIYEVTNRRVKTGASPDEVEAFLTLDQEIVLTDILDPIGTPQSVRTVWVFPPPVESERLSDGSPIFVGSPPVIGIDKRVLSVSPKN